MRNCTNRNYTDIIMIIMIIAGVFLRCIFENIMYMYYYDSINTDSQRILMYIKRSLIMLIRGLSSYHTDNKK